MLPVTPRPARQIGKAAPLPKFVPESAAVNHEPRKPGSTYYRRKVSHGAPSLRAKRSNPGATHAALDRFVAALLAMTPVSPIYDSGH
jgi:hypothetical protein